MSSYRDTRRPRFRAAEIHLLDGMEALVDLDACLASEGWTSNANMDVEYISTPISYRKGL